MTAFWKVPYFVFILELVGKTQVGSVSFLGQYCLLRVLAGMLATVVMANFSLPVWASDADPQSAQSVQSPGQSSQAMPPISVQQPQLGEVDYWIDPDRPHIADSSVNVPKGLMLQENGFQQLYVNRQSNIFDFPETLMRLGVANRTELRYNVPNFFAQSVLVANPDQLSLRERTAGFQNMQAGFKYRLGPLGPTKFQIAVNPYISIPTGFNKQSSHVDPFIKFPFSQEINEHWDIEGMQSLFDPTGPDGRRNLDWQSSIVLNRSWGRQKNAFIEYVGDVFQHGPMSNIIHFGAAYRPGRRQQMDVQFGFRMNNAAPIAFFGFGYSFLLGSLNNPRLTPSRFKH
jgi:hypothetical protein